MASSTGLFTRAFTVLALAYVALAAQGNSAPVLSTYQGKGANLTVSKTGPEYTTIAFDGSELAPVALTKGFETYDFVAIDGEAVIPQDGAPALPQVTRFYRIPATGGADLVIQSADYDLVEDYDALPYVEEGHEFRVDSKDAMIYGTDDWYPQSIAEISAPMIMRDFRVVTVTLHPVQVNPVTRQARIYRNIQVDVVPNNEASINEITRYRRPTGSWAPIYQNLIVNLDDMALDDATTTPGTYIILADDHATVNPWTDSLMTWKKRSGHDVIVEKRASWTASQMVTFVRAAYDSLDENPVEFVCIMGDPEPADFGMPTDGGNYDHTLAKANESDDLEDIGVGRICASNSNEFATIFAKIAAYERNPNMAETNWFRRAFLYAGTGNEIASNYTTLQWVGQQLALHTAIDTSTILTHSGSVNNATVQTEINEGVGIFLWRGSWLNQMGNECATGCNNGTKLPICLTVTCTTGDFNFGTDVSESWVLAGTAANPKGGVCCVGMATSGTHHPENICVTGGLGYAIANLQIEHIGHCINSAKMWLTTTFGVGSSSATNFSRWFNLMGDPGISIWTDIPQVVEVTHSPALNVGARSLVVHVADDQSGIAVEGALVTAWKGSECYVKGLTDVNGDLTLPVTVSSAGSLMLTVTKRNLKPYLTDIQCVSADQMVAYSSMTVDDDNAGGTFGNGNGIPNPGETIDLSVTLRNSGSSVTATSVSATLTSTSPNLTVVTGNSTYANIAPNQQATGANAFRVQISNDAQHDEIIPLNFTVTASTVQTISAVDFVVNAAALEYSSHTFTGAFGPGTTNDLSVTIRNNGTVTMSGVTARLISGSPFVSVEVGNVSFPDVAVNGTANNNANRFRLNANTLTFPGHQAPMTLILSGNGGFADTTYFNAIVGTAAGDDPCGPDGYGYYAYDNTDVDYELSPDFEYVNISAGLGIDLNIDDVGEKTLTTQMYAVARALPFPVTYYGMTYDSVTICSNGWLGFTSQAFGDHFRNYPIPAQAAPVAMVAPYWDDQKTDVAGKGVWWYYDEAEDRLIVQWKTKCGGFSFTDADLDYEVIIYGQTLTPTLDGNCRLLFQYNDVTMNLNGTGSETPGSTIGIQDHWGTTGLQLAFKSALSPGVSSVVDGRAILITTDARALFGTMVGTVVNEETSLPMQGVRVSMDGFNYNALTDANGEYTITNVLIGEYTMRAQMEDFNDAIVSGVLVELDSTDTANFSMVHPEFALSQEELTIAYPAQGSATFNVINDGNGPLDYQIRLVNTMNGEELQNWDAVQHVELSAQTGDFQMLGCEFADGYWYVTGGAGPTGTNWIYRFDRDGQSVGQPILQPSTSPFGWYDLAYDGQYLYGSEDGTGTIVGIDMSGNQVNEIPSPLNPTRALAYDPSLDRFWVADFTQNIYQIDRDGNIFTQVVNEGANELAITGLAWWAQDPDGYKLYIFSRDGGTNQTRVTRMHPTTYDRITVAVLEDADYVAGGCAVTADYNSMLVTFGGILQNSTGDRLGVYQMKFDQSWATITPASSTVEGGTVREISVVADLADFRDDEYTLSLFIYNDVLDQEIELPLTLDVTTAIGDNPGEELIPREYALQQNFPNPFNPSTMIEYNLRETQHTRLSVYNIAGQEVARLVDGMQEAGAHSVMFDAAGMPSGMYFYRLQSGDFSRTAKMVLLK